jgi:hypothetical protein
MATDWSKLRRRAQARTAKRDNIEIARILHEDEPKPQLSKEEARAEMASALARYRGAVHKLPTIVEVKCYRCNHRGRASMPNGNTAKRFKCSKCGALSLKM